MTNIGQIYEWLKNDPTVLKTNNLDVFLDIIDINDTKKGVKISFKVKSDKKVLDFEFKTTKSMSSNLKNLRNTVEKITIS